MFNYGIALIALSLFLIAVSSAPAGNFVTPEFSEEITSSGGVVYVFHIEFEKDDDGNDLINEIKDVEILDGGIIPFTTSMETNGLRYNADAEEIVDLNYLNPKPQEETPLKIARNEAARAVDKSPVNTLHTNVAYIIVVDGTVIELVGLDQPESFDTWHMLSSLKEVLIRKNAHFELPLQLSKYENSSPSDFPADACNRRGKCAAATK